MSKFKVINDPSQKVPIKVWSDLEKVEAKAIQQLKNTAALPFVYKHIAAMPDVHLGIGATVGSVVATKGAICPACVGVDIGCGMMAVKTDLDYRVVQDKVVDIRHSIEYSVPVGFDQHKHISDEIAHNRLWNTNIALLESELKSKAMKQLGTLGGGNHFIELCLDEHNNVWVMLHSGSRGVGNKIATRHINDAKDLMARMFINLPDKDLAYFAMNTPQFNVYMHDLMWCQEYALENRKHMMNAVLKDLSFAVHGEDGKVGIKDSVNCHHNYVAREHHYGENVLVTRKGAVRAQVGDMGIIPGSMGTKSYIVRGLGNPESFNSCSHGAGRRMSRTQAQKQFTMEDFAKQTEGVECRKDSGVLDEIPGAYKDIDEVMENQKDLVEIVATLKQFLCIKG